MSRFPHRRPSGATIIALLALVISLGGTAVAATHFINGKLIKPGSLPANRIKSHSIGGGQLKVSSLPTVPRSNFATTANNANTLGGIAASGFQHSPMWALVKADGSGIIAQSGGISIEFHLVGGYYLHFPAVVDGHPISATISQIDGVAGGQTSAAPCGGAPDGLPCAHGTNTTSDAFIATTNPAGGQVDRPFYVIVF